MDLEVTSVSRKPEPFYATAGAVSVMTGTEVRQTGSRIVADALRYAPGVQVARADARAWAITVRGFNASNPNKLLVLMDGRSVYTPLFSGVLWDVQDTFLPDLDRVEVIRGPGATMWGANAVNGVISITTKDSRYTQGGLLTVGGGTEERAFVSARHGGQVPGKFFYRVYAKHSLRDDLVNNSGSPTGDESEVTQGGFRIDSMADAETFAYTVQGDYYSGEVGALDGTKTPLSGGNIVLRGTKRFGDKELITQFYFDHVTREVYRQYGEVRNTYDFDSQLHFQPWEHHDVVTGLNYRSSSDHTGKNGPVQFDPSARRIESGGVFVQDEIRWKEGRYGLILGSKFEHHESVGLEILPSVRGAVRVGKSTAWASVSRAVRTPSRYDDDLRLPNLTRPTLVGSRAFKSEVVIAYEAGYRAQLVHGLTVDLSGFYNDYDRLRSVEPQAGRIPIPRVISNLLEAKTYGGELSLKWQPMPRWRLHASYSYLEKEFRAKAGSRDTTLGSGEANDPKHQANFRSSLRLPGDVEWDVGLRYVSELEYPYEEAYFTADTRLLWRFRGRWEVALVGQNLLDPAHSEFGSSVSRQVQRGFYGSITWEY
jgi:iron complex outermembrane recepter protein